MDRCTLLHLVVFLFIVVYNAKCEETRHYKFNPQLCDLNQKISADTLQTSTFSYEISTLDIHSTRTCQAVFKSCVTYANSLQKKECCNNAKRFCEIHSKYGACGVYCGCWQTSCYVYGSESGLPLYYS
ncbi:uncharacterized protein LOC130612465 isoform X1 [Hydractinia symbiolongicarpus]|uniref:uncharacterized protein LOC130612465 isoform X1 n=1 Tax=Hydractinia symbiolongicarpus TaxID=13093 RepID=UPI002549F139|nr:uncharacterized protein LOC130612465 isoform X1 [Hydractinia symbiolongicarpus]